MYPPLQQITGTSEHTGTDRRNSTRYPMAEEVSFKLLDTAHGPKQEGAGTTIDMGRGGVLFSTPVPPSPGRLLEVSVNWPVALDGTCPLKFVAVGHVVRASGTTAAVRIERYQFKTRGRAPQRG